MVGCKLEGSGQRTANLDRERRKSRLRREEEGSIFWP